MVSKWGIRGSASMVLASCVTLVGLTAQEASMASTIQTGVTVHIEYTLTVEGKVVDSSEGREPLSYVHGQGQIIPGLERELEGLSVGDSKDVTVDPKEGYGTVDSEAFITVPKEQLPSNVTPEVGQALQGMSPDGRPFRAMIHEIEEANVVLDLNHPLAGKTLVFAVKVVNINPAQ